MPARSLFKGKPVAGPGPERGVVFQTYSLMPWLSGARQYRAGGRSRFGRQARNERARARRSLHRHGRAFTRRRASARGAVGRHAPARRGGPGACHADPEILLLDEPLSALDALTRAKLQDEISEIWSRDKRTVVLITNDVDEAHPARRPHHSAAIPVRTPASVRSSGSVRAPARPLRDQ